MTTRAHAARRLAMPHGKICYLEIPATDVDTSAGFYEKVFGWQMRIRDNGERAFDDATGQVSGTFCPGRPPAVEPGVLTYIMVDSIETTSATITGTGGEITKPLTPLDLNGAAFATFRDPAGNLFGLYQEGHR